MSYEYLMQALLLIFMLVLLFPAIILWAKWRKRRRR